MAPASRRRPDGGGHAGIDRVYTPKDFDLNRIMGDIADLVAARATASQPA